MALHVAPDEVRARTAPCRVFVSPDFFIDHLVRYPGAYSDLVKEFNRIMGQGGGNVLGTEQYITKGGNAVNTAVALGRLGIRTTLFTKTSRVGLHLLKLFTEDLPIDLSLVDSRGSPSITTALEVRDDNGRLSNMMISDSGSLLSIGPGDVTEDVAASLRRMDLVCVFNWAQTKRGTEIAEKVFSTAKDSAHCLTFIDISDPSYRLGEIPSLVERLFKPGLVDVLGLNENELRRIAASLGMNASESERGHSLSFLKQFANRLGCAVDYHTTDFSASASGEGVFQVPSFQVSPVRMTGAGDTWNAGNIVGYLAKLEPTDRLLLANAAAGFYISNPEPVPPTLDDAMGFSATVPRKNITGSF